MGICHACTLKWHGLTHRQTLEILVYDHDLPVGLDASVQMEGVCTSYEEGVPGYLEVAKSGAF